MKGWTPELRAIQAKVAARQEREQAEAIAENGPLLAEFVRWCSHCIMPTTHGCGFREPRSAVRCRRCNREYVPKKGTLCLEEGE